MRKPSSGFVTVLALAAAVSVSTGRLSEAQPRGPSPAGAWKMSIDFADGARAAGLEIKIDGRKITGRFIASFAGDIAIEGDLAGSTLTFSGTTTDGPHPGIQLDFTATAKDEGTLEGNVSMPFGDFKWTAERLVKPPALDEVRAVSIRQAPSAAPSLTGQWQMTIVHGQDHGVPVGLELQQSGNTVTGTFHTPRSHGDPVPLDGEFTEGTLRLRGGEDEKSSLELRGTLKEDGTLQGTLWGRMGRMTWTAERLGKPPESRD